MVKVERSYPAPASLAIEATKASGRYDCSDVVERLLEDFHEKCYICEIDELQDPEIEHLLPHKGGIYPERKFDWDNLFLSCGHCNSVKNQVKYDAGIMDCCKVDPEEHISCRLINNQTEIFAREESDQTIKLTAELIHEVFNKKNTEMRVYKSDMRLKALNAEMNVLYKQLEKYKANPNSLLLKRTLKALLRRESKFAAFKRNYIRDCRETYPDLLQYLT